MYIRGYAGIQAGIYATAAFFASLFIVSLLNGLVSFMMFLTFMFPMSIAVLVGNIFLFLFSKHKVREFKAKRRVRQTMKSHR